MQRLFDFASANPVILLLIICALGGAAASIVHEWRGGGSCAGERHDPPSF